MLEKSPTNIVIGVIVFLAFTTIIGVSCFVAGIFANMFWLNEYPIFDTSPDVVVTCEDVPQEFDVFWEAWELVDEGFYGEIPTEQERVYGAIRGMVITYGDQNTAFIEPVQAKMMQENASGSFEGIGAMVRVDDNGRLLIAEPFPDRPAAKAGLKRDDMVLEVDGISIQGYSIYESVSLIRGEKDTTVILTIFREGVDEPFDVSIVRAKIEIEVVRSELLDNNIGYVNLTEFSKDASDKLKKAIRELEKQGADKLILDLRSNPGGYLSEAIAVSSLFIEEGIILHERGRTEANTRLFEAFGGAVVPDMPLIVLINGGSASASEIVAGALLDHERAVIIGEQSFGKGTVQMPYTLSNGSELRVTIAQWFTPDDKLIHKEGIKPDIEIELTEEDFDNDLDPQLDKAIEYLLEDGS
ncbi:MAG: hypothetical protein B6242_08185 [Anaerolineaceae bacterium 4572_78]|nr:MAG: hypothetical protein B6242_08185 [Anaerolineaceae bacterium 4572_78]